MIYRYNKMHTETIDTKTAVATAFITPKRI